MANRDDAGGLLVLEHRSNEIKAIADSGRLEEAIDMREELLRDLEHGGATTRRLLVTNRFRQAATLQLAGQTTEALAVLEQCVDMARVVPTSERASVEAEAYWRMCRYNANSGDCAEAVEAADELVRRHLHTESVAETVVSALSMKASCLGPDKLNQPEEQLETLELMLNRFGTSKSDRIQSGVALANFTRAALLETRGGWREAVSIWADLFEQLRWHPPTKARWVPFRSQTARVDTLLRAQEADEALSAGLALIEQLGDAEPGEGLSDLAKAAFNIALAFERAGRLTEASRFFQVTAERLSGSDDADLTSLGILARVNAIQTLGRLGDIDGAMQEALAIVSAGEPAIAVTSKIIEEARRDGTKLEREREPWALLVQALVLAKLGRERQARDRLTEIINEFSNDDSPVAAQLVGAARYALIKLPGQQPS